MKASALFHTLGSLAIAGYAATQSHGAELHDLYMALMWILGGTGALHGFMAWREKEATVQAAAVKFLSEHLPNTVNGVREDFAKYLDAQLAASTKPAESPK